jgi:hypothetical protein
MASMHYQHSGFLVYNLFSVSSFLQEHRREGSEWKEEKGREESNLELRVERRKIFSAAIIIF